MKNSKLAKIFLNFSGVILLIALIGAPFYFARNFAKVAGVKSTAQYLLVSQIEKFPNLKFSQEADIYTVTFDKFGSSQVYLGIMVINNPTPQTQTYHFQVTSGQAELFFGVDSENRLTTISLPSTASVPVSLFSGEETSTESQKVEFKVVAK